MFNQTTPGWMHWSSLPDTAGFLDTERLQTSQLLLRPPLSQSLCRAMPLHVMTASYPWWYQLVQKRTTSLITFQCHHTRITAPWLVLSPHKQERHKAPSSKWSSHWKQATDTETSSSPSPRTWMARTKQVFQRCLQGTEIKRKGLTAQLTRCIERL